MPDYCQISDLQSRMSAIELAQFGVDDSIAFPVKTLSQANAALADTTVQANINACIDDAETEWNSIIVGAIDTTDTSLWQYFKPWVAHIAIYNLHARHRGEVPEQIVLMRQNAQQQARDIAKGTVHFTRDPQTRAAQSRSVPTVTSNNYFNRRTFLGFSERTCGQNPEGYFWRW